MPNVIVRRRLERWYHEFSLQKLPVHIMHCSHLRQRYENQREEQEVDQKHGDGTTSTAIYQAVYGIAIDQISVRSSKHLQSCRNPLDHKSPSRERHDGNAVIEK